MTSLIKGANDFLKDDLEEALSAYSSAVEIIEGPLMDGMNLVGEHFASGKMFLPQVVRSAKMMQNAVTILSPHISDTDDDHNKSLGNIIMATLKGDVHDIGKNIVAVVLKCNNINVIDLGVMCPAEKIVETAITEKADIIGLCGLITPSLTEMVNAVTAPSKAGISVPVLIGGATTSELHTALKIAPAYNGPVIWSKDAAQTSIIATTLLNPTKRDALITTYADRYQKLREKYAQENEGQKANLQDARRNKLNLFNCNCCNT
jgi:5-methyltetrahydrofolate--homocysteine methyltransferase